MKSVSSFSSIDIFYNIYSLDFICFKYLILVFNLYNGSAVVIFRVFLSGFATLYDLCIHNLFPHLRHSC